MLKDATVLSIAAAGGGSDEIDFENFDSKGVSGFVKAARSASVIDAFSAVCPPPSNSPT